MSKLFYIRMNTSVAFPIFHFLVNLIWTLFCSSENVTWKTSRVNFFIKRHSRNLIWVNGRSSMCIQQKISRSLKGWTVANLQAWSHVILLPNSTGLIFFFKENLTLKMRKKIRYHFRLNLRVRSASQVTTKNTVLALASFRPFCIFFQFPLLLHLYNANFNRPLQKNICIMLFKMREIYMPNRLDGSICIIIEHQAQTS